MKTIQLNHNHHKVQSKKHPVCLLANDINDSRNVGSIFRIADAFGIDKIYLTGTSPVPPNSKINKTSRSTEKYIPYSYSESALKLVRQLKSSGYKIVSLEITSSSIDIRDFSITDKEKICLILGSENVGVSQELLDVSDCAIHIPMLGQNSSMNLATACAIAIFEIIKKYLP